MSDANAPDGSALSIAIIGVEDMDKSLLFYRDVIGLTANRCTSWQGKAFESLWHLPPGSKADAVFCELPTCEVGRVLLLDFKMGKRKRIRQAKASCMVGLVNLNFYTDDIHKDSTLLQSKGYTFWSKPTNYTMSESAGAPTEVVFEGPDGVPINLVELNDPNPATSVGRMAIYVRKHGRTSTGYTPVVTSNHSTHDIDAATEFYKRVLKCDVLINEVMDTASQNYFLRLPEKARTAVRFMKGNHMFGKIALSAPLNYDCEDLVKDQHAPNIGYLCQSYMISNLSAAASSCADQQVEIYTSEMDITIPGIGSCRTMIVKCPGSGTLQQLIEAN